MPFRDRDGDGLDDETGLSPGEYARFGPDSRGNPDAGPGSGVIGPDGSSPYRDAYAEEAGSSPYGGRSAMTPEEYAAYRDQRRDADAGRPSTDASGNPSQASDSQLGVSGLSDFDESSAGTFLWGDITGATARHADYVRRRQDAERQAWITQAEEYLPSADDLWVQYEEEGFIGGPERSEAAQARADRGSIEAQQDALRYLQDVYGSEGMTDADRARQTLARMQSGQAARAARDADLAALEARGMGGSGAALASRLGAQQGAAQSLAQQDALMLIEAQARADRAAQAAGGLGSTMRGQSFDESYARGSAADDFNRYQTDYARARESRNTALRNRTRESRAESRQQSYGNRRDIAALRTGQYSPTRDPGQVADESNERTGGFLGGLISSLGSL